ncbi:single-stranded DNA-binding protein [Kribbella sp. NPDC005582]|uniref:single-stranded DNA-binding protein n=1 Tax=Kribbella sp. NPDC005582 TaxID=3156893 RepID=UPI0033BDE7EE
MSETYVTVQGWVGSEPQFKEVGGRTPTATFRVGSTPRWQQPDGAWTDRPTTWFNVECWRTLAQNTFESIHVGQPVIVTGRLRTREWTTDAGELRSRVVLDAVSVGHDLSRGTTVFTKSAPRAEAPWPDQLRHDTSDSAPSDANKVAASTGARFTGEASTDATSTGGPDTLAASAGGANTVAAFPGAPSTGAADTVAALPGAASAGAAAAGAASTSEPGLGAPYPPDEFTTTTLPLTPTTREAEAA